MRYDGPTRASSRGQGHGRGRGGYKSTRRNAVTSRFKTTRIEEKASSDSEHSDRIPAQIVDSGDSSSGFSDDEAEQGLDKAKTKAYDMLLQHLASTPQPQQKKRKIRETEEREDAESSENDKDFVEELEDSEIWGEDDHVDLDDEVGPQGGNLFLQYPCETLLKVADYSPFDLHFAEPEESNLATMIENVQNKLWVTLKKELAPTWSSISRIPANSNETFSTRQEPIRDTDQISVSGPPQ